MNTYSNLSLNAVIALSKQKYEELIAIRPLDALVNGDRGNHAQSVRVESLLTDLHTLVIRIRSDLAIQLLNEESPLLTLSPSHSEFLTLTLLPNARNIEKAYFHGDLLAELFEDEDDLEPISHTATIKDSIWFTAEFTNLLMESDDERRLAVDITFEIVDQPWFQPDTWSSNLRSLRPIIVGIESKNIPLRIRARLSEIHRSFTFGAWMATIALCRAVVEFALIDRAPNYGYTSTSVSRDGSETFLTLDKLINTASNVIPQIHTDLELLREAGNRILHPKKKRNVIPLPKILRSEAFLCVQAATRALEFLYRRSS